MSGTWILNYLDFRCAFFRFLMDRNDVMSHQTYLSFPGGIPRAPSWRQYRPGRGTGRWWRWRRRCRCGSSRWRSRRREHRCSPPQCLCSRSAPTVSSQPLLRFNEISNVLIWIWIPLLILNSKVESEIGKYRYFQPTKRGESNVSTFFKARKFLDNYTDDGFLYPDLFSKKNPDTGSSLISKKGWLAFFSTSPVVKKKYNLAANLAASDRIKSFTWALKIIDSKKGFFYFLPRESNRGRLKIPALGS